MAIEERLRSTAKSLINTEGVLFLKGTGRAFRRTAGAANRPLRIGILGEPNSGKSSLANLLAGVSILPADPVDNTKLPTLLTYAPAPFVAALYESGERITFPATENIPQLLTGLYESGPATALPASTKTPQSAIKWLEVGCPGNMLRSLEILDFPCSENSRVSSLPAYDIDVAIWTTVATQAWRESELAQWLAYPQAVRSRGMLAVTYCDMIAGGQRDLKRLQARLEMSAKPHFCGIFFVAAGDKHLAAQAILDLAKEFSAERLGNGLGRTSKGRAYGVMIGAAMLLAGAVTLGAVQLGLFGAGKTPIASPAPNASEAVEQSAKAEAERRRKAEAEAADAGEAEKRRRAEVEAREAANRKQAEGEAAEAEKRRRAEVEAREAGNRKQAEGEAAEAEKRRRAEVEAADAESHNKAEAEAAKAKWRKKAEAAEARRRRKAEAAEAWKHRKAVAEEIPPRSGRNGPIMHGVGQ